MSVPSENSIVKINGQSYGVTKSPADGFWVKAEEQWFLLVLVENYWYIYVPTEFVVDNVNLLDRTTVSFTYKIGDSFNINGVNYRVEAKFIGYHIKHEVPNWLVSDNFVYQPLEMVEVKPILLPRTNNIFKMAEKKYQKYRQSEIMLPYVGLRLVSASNGDEYFNYKVVEVPKKSPITKATVIKTDMDGNPIVNFTEEITIKKDEKYRSHSKQTYSFVLNNGYIYPGIATNEGFLVTSYDDPAIAYKRSYQTVNGIPVPEVGLVATVSGPFIASKYVVVAINDNNTITLAEPNRSYAKNIQASLINGKWVANPGTVNEKKVEFGKYVSYYNPD